MNFITKRIFLASLCGLMAHTTGAMDNNSRSQSPQLPEYPTIQSRSTSPTSQLTALKELKKARLTAQAQIVNRLSDELTIARMNQYKKEFEQEIAPRSTIDVFQRADNPIAAVIHSIWHMLGANTLVSRIALFRQDNPVARIESQLMQALQEYDDIERLPSRPASPLAQPTSRPHSPINDVIKPEVRAHFVGITELDVLRQTGNACGFHATTNARAIDILMEQQTPITAEHVTMFTGEILNVQACPDDVLRNDNEIMDYATNNRRHFTGVEEGLHLDNVYMLGKLDGTTNTFEITCYKENGIVCDERPDMELIAGDFNFQVDTVPTDILRDIFNLNTPIMNLRRQVMNNGRGVVHFILGCPGHYVHASVTYTEHEGLHIYYSDSLKTSLEGRPAALEMVQYIQSEFAHAFHQ